ncbi:MAG: hypothetical protein ACOYMA_08540 [Bacteroidia bacterium]
MENVNDQLTQKQETELLYKASIEMPLVYQLCIRMYDPYTNDWVKPYLLQQKANLISCQSTDNSEKIQIINLLIQKFESNTPF